MVPASQGRGENRHTMATPRKVIIIGSGPAGYTAAIYAARANLVPLMINGVQAGGQLMLTTHVENYPGFVDPVLGPELMETMRKQAERFGTDTLRASKIMQDRAFANPKISFVWNSEVVDILDPAVGKVTGVVLRDVVTGARSERRADGVFVAIGHLPNTAIFRGQVDLLPSGYVRVEPGTTRTSVPGVFAAGDVQDAAVRQGGTAAGVGVLAVPRRSRRAAPRAAPVRRTPPGADGAARRRWPCPCSR